MLATIGMWTNYLALIFSLSSIIFGVYIIVVTWITHRPWVLGFHANDQLRKLSLPAVVPAPAIAPAPRSVSLWILICKLIWISSYLGLAAAILFAGFVSWAVANTHASAINKKTLDDSRGILSAVRQILNENNQGYLDYTGGKPADAATAYTNHLNELTERCKTLERTLKGLPPSRFSDLITAANSLAIPDITVRRFDDLGTIFDFKYSTSQPSPAEDKGVIAVKPTGDDYYETIPFTHAGIILANKNKGDDAASVTELNKQLGEATQAGAALLDEAADLDQLGLHKLAMALRVRVAIPRSFSAQIITHPLNELANSAADLNVVQKGLAATSQSLETPAGLSAKENSLLVHALDVYEQDTDRGTQDRWCRGLAEFCASSAIVTLENSRVLFLDRWAKFQQQHPATDKDDSRKKALDTIIDAFCEQADGQISHFDKLNANSDALKPYPEISKAFDRWKIEVEHTRNLKTFLKSYLDNRGDSMNASNKWRADYADALQKSVHLLEVQANEMPSAFDKFDAMVGDNTALLNAKRNALARAKQLINYQVFGAFPFDCKFDKADSVGDVVAAAMEKKLDDIASKEPSKVLDVDSDGIPQSVAFEVAKEGAGQVVVFLNNLWTVLYNDNYEKLKDNDCTKNWQDDPNLKIASINLRLPTVLHWGSEPGEINKMIDWMNQSAGSADNEVVKQSTAYLQRADPISTDDLGKLIIATEKPSLNAVTALKKEIDELKIGFAAFDKDQKQANNDKWTKVAAQVNLFVYGKGGVSGRGLPILGTEPVQQNTENGNPDAGKTIDASALKARLNLSDVQLASILAGIPSDKIINLPPSVSPMLKRPDTADQETPHN